MINTDFMRNNISRSGLNGISEQAVLELLDYLEAAEKQVEALRAEIEAVHSLLDNDESKIIRNAKDGYPEGREPKELTLTERVTALCKYAADWERWCSEAESKIEQMKQQKPVAWTTQLALELGGSALGFDACRGNLWGDKGVPLYALPGAQNVPKEAISKILTEVMDIAVSNGADSRSMPDEYVEVAAWLCRYPT